MDKLKHMYDIVKLIWSGQYSEPCDCNANGFEYDFTSIKCIQH